MAATLADAKAVLGEALREETEEMLLQLQSLKRGVFAQSASEYLDAREPRRNPFIKHE
ncbi:hypothetical protein G7068_12075 [Leucobacter viscericola]|uniref:Uncharacterized protein n=1 Tax=Leucobacter viscericola TaxID=2714935 RepID=A0A6G7XH92_9MICO|nr:hypothetical protein [Leucobacter viscericola]QIK63846.1 hypothetical protein G7068_12075 [Leucobacter viscericola]